MSDLGLKMGDIDLININGPVSLVLIVPKNIGPIILLFGEIHVKIDKGCTDDKPHEYKVQFNTILTKLNELASNEEFSIEFYKEQGLSICVSKDIDAGRYSYTSFEIFNRESAKKSVGLNAEISKENVCFYNKLKLKDPDIYKRLCSYPNIKWQYSDSRYFRYKSGDIKEFTGMYNIGLFVCSISDLYIFLLKNLTDTDVNNQIKEFLNNSSFYKYEGKLFIEINLTGIDLQVYINKLKLFDLFYKRKFDLMIERLLESYHISKQLKHKTEEEKEELKYKLTNYLIYWRDILETDIEFVNVNNYVLSLLDIYITFLESITIVDIDNPSVYTETMRNNFKAMIDYVKTTKINLLNFVPDKTSVIDVSSLTEEQLTEIKNTIILNISIAPYSIILDVYFILRVLKKKVSKPTLICSLIGFKHVENIAHFFEQEDYTVYAFNQTAADTFCVNTSKAKIKIRDSFEKVDFNMDLVELLNEQREKIISQSAGYRKRKSRKKNSIRRKFIRRKSKRRSARRRNFC